MLRLPLRRRTRPYSAGTTAADPVPSGSPVRVATSSCDGAGPTPRSSWSVARLRACALVLLAATAVATVAIDGDAAAAPRDRRPPLVRDRWLRAALLDWVDRHVDIVRDGEPVPTGGLSRDGQLEDGRRAHRRFLEKPPANSADMITVAMYIDTRERRYWVLQTGGITAREYWVGPFSFARR